MVRISQSSEKEIKKGLYLVSTPIGNLGDITFRAVEILRNSDFILCEDTRISRVLLNKFQIKSELISYHKFNEKKNLSKIMHLLNQGSVISIISDAGTPSISDPGAILVNECIENNIDVIPVPGPSSVISAVSVSGFSEKFFFYGFFPDKKKIIENDMKKLSEINSTIVFFVSSKKINKILPFIKINFSGRKMLICKEMTKYFEEYLRFEVDKIHKFNFDLKGELTVVISEEKKDKKKSQTLSESDKKLIKDMIKKLSVKEISNLISQTKKVPKREIYNYCLSLKK
tara:strand:+ start:2287 stop:3144 length:858 start_codon:yes stop_codon:yes gene_type:complete